MWLKHDDTHFWSERDHSLDNNKEPMLGYSRNSVGGSSRICFPIYLILVKNSSCGDFSVADYRHGSLNSVQEENNHMLQR